MNFLEHLKGFFSNKTEYSKGMYTLFKLEAKLAKLNLLPVLIGLIVLFALAITVWLTLMILIGYLIIFFAKQPLTAIITILLLNFLLAAYLIRNIKQRLQQMSFARTRDCLKASDERNESEPKERAIKVNSRANEES